MREVGSESLLLCRHAGMRRWCTVAVPTVAVSVACGSDAPSPPPPPTPHLATTRDYLPGLAADVYLPTGATSAVVVVLVPGGAWQTADRTGLTPLAEYLAGAGVVAVNTTHRAVADDGRFPGPVQEVTCSVDFAVQQAQDAGLAVRSVVVLGHSSGAHLAALAALGGDHFRGPCPYPPATIDAFVGLAGSYDVDSLPELAEPFFGASRQDDPATWIEGNPTTWAGKTTQRARLRALLLHGAADTDLPTTFTTEFAAAMKAGGHDVTVQVVPGATHHTLYSPEVSGARLVSWLKGLPRPSSTT